MRFVLLALAVTTLLAGLAILARGAHVTSTPSAARDSRPQPVQSALDLTPHAPATIVMQSMVDVQQHETALVEHARAEKTLRRDDMAALHRELDLVPGLDEAARARAHRELSERLRLLARELELAPTQETLARLLREATEAPSAAKRAQLVSAYRLEARALPPMHRSDALAKLDALQ